MLTKKKGRSSWKITFTRKNAKITYGDSTLYTTKREKKTEGELY